MRDNIYPTQCYDREGNRVSMFATVTFNEDRRHSSIVFLQNEHEYRMQVQSIPTMSVPGRGLKAAREALHRAGFELIL